MVRLLLFLLGTLTTGRPGRRETAGYRAAGPGVRTEPDVEYPRPDRYGGGGGAWQDQPAPVAPWPPGTIGGGDPRRGPGSGSGPRRLCGAQVSSSGERVAALSAA